MKKLLILLPFLVAGCELSKDIKPTIHTPNNEPSIAMVGDSLTAGYDWNTALGRDDIHNLGVGSANLKNIYDDQIPQAIALNVQSAFVLGGVNNKRPDLSFDVGQEDGAYKPIIDDLMANGITVVVQSTTKYAKSHAYAINNSRIDALNEQLQGYCKQVGIVYLDLNQYMCDADGYLKPEYTSDGLHLSAAGYRVWETVLKDFLINKGGDDR